MNLEAYADVNAFSKTMLLRQLASAWNIFIQTRSSDAWMSACTNGADGCSCGLGVQCIRLLRLASLWARFIRLSGNGKCSGHAEDAESGHVETAGGVPIGHLSPGR